MRTRQITAAFRYASEANLDLITSSYRAAGRYNPFLLIPDATDTEVFWVKWGSSPTWLFDTLYSEAQGRYTINVAFDEVGRGLKP